MGISSLFLELVQRVSESASQRLASGEPLGGRHCTDLRSRSGRGQAPRGTRGTAIGGPPAAATAAPLPPALGWPCSHGRLRARRRPLHVADARRSRRNLPLCARAARACGGRWRWCPPPLPRARRGDLLAPALPCAACACSVDPGSSGARVGVRERMSSRSCAHVLVRVWFRLAQALEYCQQVRTSPMGWAYCLDRVSAAQRWSCVCRIRLCAHVSARSSWPERERERGPAPWP